MSNINMNNTNQERIIHHAKELLDNIDIGITSSDHGKMTLEYTSLIMRCKLDVSDSNNWQYFNTFKNEWQFIFNGLPRKIPTANISIHDYDHYSRIPDKGFLNNYNECLYNSRHGFIRVRTIHAIGRQMVFIRSVPVTDEDEIKFYLVPVTALRIFHEQWFAKYRETQQPIQALPTHYRGNTTLYKPLWFWDLRLAATDAGVLRPAYKIPDAANQDCPCNITQTIRNNMDLRALAQDDTIVIWVHCGKITHIKSWRICSSDTPIELAGTLVSFTENKMTFNKDDNKDNDNSALNDGNVDKNRVRVMDNVANNSWNLADGFANLSMNWNEAKSEHKADDMNTSLNSALSGFGRPLDAQRNASDRNVPNTPHIQSPRATLNRNPNRISKLQSQYDPTPYTQRIGKMTMATSNRMARTLRTYPSAIGNGFVDAFKNNDAQNSRSSGHDLSANPMVDNNASFNPSFNTSFVHNNSYNQHPNDQSIPHQQQAPLQQQQAPLHRQQAPPQQPQRPPQQPPQQPPPMDPNHHQNPHLVLPADAAQHGDYHHMYKPKFDPEKHLKDCRFEGKGGGNALLQSIDRFSWKMERYFKIPKKEWGAIYTGWCMNFALCDRMNRVASEVNTDNIFAVWSWLGTIFKPGIDKDRNYAYGMDDIHRLCDTASMIESKYYKYDKLLSIDPMII